MDKTAKVCFSDFKSCDHILLGRFIVLAFIWHSMFGFHGTKYVEEIKKCVFQEIDHLNRNTVKKR